MSLPQYLTLSEALGMGGQRQYVACYLWTRVQDVMYNGSCTLGLEVVYNSSVFPFLSSLFVMLKGSAFLRVGIAHAATSFVREGCANTPT